MWNFGFILVAMVVVIMGVVTLLADFVRDRFCGVAAHGGCGLGRWLERIDLPSIGELSAGQTRFVSALRVVGCIGVVIVWAAFVSMLVHLGGLHLAQLWQNDHQARATINALLYTSLVLTLMRPRISVWAPASWRQRTQLASHAFMMLVFFMNAFLAITDVIDP